MLPPDPEMTGGRQPFVPGGSGPERSVRGSQPPSKRSWCSFLAHARSPNILTPPQKVIETHHGRPIHQHKRIRHQSDFPEHLVHSSPSLPPSSRSTGSRPGPAPRETSPPSSASPYQKT